MQENLDIEESEEEYLLEEDEVVHHPWPANTPLFYSLLGASLLVVALPAWGWVQANSSDLYLSYILCTWFVGTLATVLLGRRGPVSKMSEIAAWGFLVCSILSSLLCWTSFGTTFGISFALTFAAMATGLFFQESRSHARCALLGLLFLLPAIYKTGSWSGFTTFMCNSVARLSSAVLDGLGVPNERLGLILRTTQGTLDVTTSAVGVFGIEVLLAFSLLYFLVRRTPFFPLTISTAALFGVWISLQSTYWSLYGRHLEFVSSDLESLKPIVIAMLMVGIFAIPIVELFVRSLLGPIPPDAIATEFPLLIQLYNLSMQYPDRGLIAFGNDQAELYIDTDDMEDQ